MGTHTDALTVTQRLLAECPPAPPTSMHNPDDASTAAWMRAVAAIVAVMASDAAPQLFNEVMEMFRRTPELFANAVRTHPGQSRDLFSSLGAGQIAELFLWARGPFPSRRVQPGVVIKGDLVEDKIDRLLDLLRNRRDLAAADALQTVASTISNVWLAQEAKRLRDEVLTSQRPAPSPAALMEIFADPRRRSITTRAELASLILEELDGLQHDLQHDRALRAQVWHRQRRDDNWQGYVGSSLYQVGLVRRGGLTGGRSFR